MNRFNLVYENIMKNLLMEGGHAVNNVSKLILRENIQKTIDYFNKLIFLPLNISSDLWTAEIGSTGKKSASGDIDLAVNFKEIGERLNLNSTIDAMELIKNKIKENGFDVVAKGGENALISCAFPIQGTQEGEFIQVDLFPSTSLKFAKFNRHAPAEGDSKYKGAVRSDLTATIIKVITMAAVKDGLPEDVINEPYITNDGIEYPGKIFSYNSVNDSGVNKITKSFIGKRGNVTTNARELNRSFLYEDPTEMLDDLFGKDKYTEKDFDSFESIWNNVLWDDEFPFPQLRDKIITHMYNSYKKQNKEIPSEIIEYLEKNNVK